MHEYFHSILDMKITIFTLSLTMKTITTVKPLILALVLGSITDVLINQLPFEYSRPVIFLDLLRSLNSRNIGHTKISGFTVYGRQLVNDNCFTKITL